MGRRGARGGRAAHHEPQAGRPRGVLRRAAPPTRAGVGLTALATAPPATAPHVHRRARLESLTALRWFAATAVFVRHTGWRHGIGQQGVVGVSFFFVLSGFVLAWSAPAVVDAADFYRRRWARVFPSHAFVLTLVLCLPFLVDDAGDRLRGVASLSLLHVWIPRPSYYLAGNSPSWSLAAEAFIYACFPFVHAGLVRRPSTQLRLLTIAVVVLAVVTPWYVRSVAPAPFAYWFTYINPSVRMLEFVIGMCLAILVGRRALPRVPVGPAAAFAALAYLVAGRAPLPGRSVVTTLAPFALLIVAVAQRDAAGEPAPILRSRALVALGRWSFAFYLLHLLLLEASRRLPLPASAEPVRVAVVYVTAIVAAAVLHTTVEQPLERRLRAGTSPG